MLLATAGLDTEIAQLRGRKEDEWHQTLVHGSQYQADLGAWAVARVVWEMSVRRYTPGYQNHLDQERVLADQRGDPTAAYRAMVRMILAAAAHGTELLIFKRQRRKKPKPKALKP